jgi:flavoprotein hydroxylase
MDTYTEERRGQATEAILASVQLGRVICVTDPAAAAERDATVLANRRGRPPARPEPAKPLTVGLLHRVGTADVVEPLTGAFIPQGRVRRQDHTGLFDDVVGHGFVLLTTEDPGAVLDADRRSFLTELGTHLVRVLPPESGPVEDAAGAIGVLDVDDVYRSYLALHNASAVLIRPDHHIFGATTSAHGLAVLVDDLRDQLRAAVPTG